MSDRATADAYLGIDLVLPDGHTLRCEPLKLDRGIYWSRTRGWSQLEPKNEEERRLRLASQLEILEKFPTEIAPDGDASVFEDLQPSEVYVLIDRFLACRRAGVVRGLDPEASADPESAPGA